MNQEGTPSIDSYQNKINDLQLKIEQLEMYKNRYLSITHHSPDGICVAGLDGRLQEANQSYCEMIGYTQSELLNMHISDIDVQQNSNQVHEHIQYLIQGHAKRFETQHRCKDGRIIDVDVSIHFTNETPPLLIAYLRDITKKKQIERDLFQANEFNHGLFDAITEPVFAIDTEGTVAMANKTCAAFFNQSIDHFIGSNLWDLSFLDIPPEIIKQRLNTLEYVIKSGKPSQYTSQTNGKYIDVCFYPVTNSDNQVTHIMIYARDMTKQISQEKQLHISDQQYRILINSASEDIVAFDSSGKIAFVNEKVAQRFGVPQHFFIGKSLYDLFPKEFADGRYHAMEQVMKTGHKNQEVIPVTINGQIFWFEETLVKLESKTESNLGAMVIARDITEIKQTREALNEFHDKMTHAERLASVGTLSAMAAHELSQPFTVLRLSTQNALSMLNKGAESKAVVEELQHCVTSLEDVSKVIGRFRHFARSKPEKTLSKLDLVSLLDRLFDLLKNACQKAQLTVQYQSLRLLPSIVAPKKELEQLIYIFIENCIEASDAQARHTLNITGTLQNNILILSFTDDCGGITPKHIDHIFQPFYTTKTFETNTGLGLCVADHIAKDLGGDIDINNRPGQGVSFLLRIPLPDSL